MTRRWWILGPALATVAVLVVALPPRVPVGVGSVGSFFGTTYYREAPHDPTGDAVRAAVRAQRWRYREQVLADSVAREARGPGALRSADGAVTVVYGRLITRDSARVWLEAGARELALYPGTETGGLPVVVALFSTPARGRITSERLMFSQAVVTLKTAAASAGACIVFVNLTPRADWYLRDLVAHDANGRPLGRFLDVCALYGRFGLPGRTISAWANRGPSWYWGGYDRLSRRMQEARRTLRPDTVAAVWTYSTYWRGAVQWAPIACLRGGTATCARIAGLEPFSTEVNWWSMRLTRGQVLTWLLASGTPAQFAAFWRSPLSPARAIEAAYGQSAGSVLMEAFRHWQRAPEPGGPRAEARAVLAGVAWAGLALALALAAGRRRMSEI